MSSRIGMLHGLPTIRQFIWIWKRSSASLRIRYLEFYLPLYSMDPLPPPLFLPAVLFNPLFLSFLSRVPVGLCRPLTRTTRIALPGISEVLSRIQRLHRPSWMDRQSSLTLRLSAPLPHPRSSFSLPPYTYPLGAPASLASSLLPPVLSPPESTIQPLDARLYTAAGYSRKIHEFRRVARPRASEYSEYFLLLFPVRPALLLRLLPRRSLS